MILVQPPIKPQQTLSIESLLAKLLNSGINISPIALLELNKQCVTDAELEKFIQKMSFGSNFNSFITIEMVSKDFNQKGAAQPQDQKNGLNQPLAVQTNSSPPIEPNIASLESKKDNPEVPPREIEAQKQEISRVQQDIPAHVEQEVTELLASVRPPSHAELNEDDPSLLITAQIPPLTKFSPDITKPAPSTPKIIPVPVAPKIAKKRISDDDENFNLDEEGEEEGSSGEASLELDDNEILINQNMDEVTRIREEKRQQWEALHIRQGTSTFRPIASDYAPNYKVIHDPTKALFTQGSIDEFVGLQVDKFTKLKAILSKRPETKGLLEINMINRLENSVEVQLIGMVVEKRQTQSHNYIIIVEDPTGICSILVRQDPPELYTLIEKLLPDHVILIDGFLRVDREKNSRLIMATNIYFPDVPNNHQIQYPEEDLAVCLISDTHFGSKDWLEKIWMRFVDYLNCRIGNDAQVAQAGKIKYLTVAGDLVDGIGVYPNQEVRLSILNIYDQYEAAAKYLAKIPDYITIIISPGDHDAVRKAVPSPAIPPEIAKGLNNSGFKLVGCPATVSLHGIKTLIYHGTSLIDINMSIPGLSNEDPKVSMTELIRARHLVPSYGKKTEIAPAEQDWLVMDPIPDIFHTGHLHKNGCGFYKNVLTINSGCFQSQTDYMKSLGIDPDFGKPTIVNLKGPRLVPKVLDLVGDSL